MTKLGVLFGEARGRGRAKAIGGGIGEIDASVPKAKAKLPDEEFDGVGERWRLREVSERTSEIVGDGGGEWVFRR